MTQVHKDTLIRHDVQRVGQRPVLSLKCAEFQHLTPTESTLNCTCTMWFCQIHPCSFHNRWCLWRNYLTDLIWLKKFNLFILMYQKQLLSFLIYRRESAEVIFVVGSGLIIRAWKVYLQTKWINSIFYNQHVTWSDKQLNFSITNILYTFLGDFLMLYGKSLTIIARKYKRVKHKEHFFPSWLDSLFILFLWFPECMYSLTFSYISWPKWIIPEQYLSSQSTYDHKSIQEFLLNITVT